MAHVRMNIRLPPSLMLTRGFLGFDPQPCLWSTFGPLTLAVPSKLPCTRAAGRPSDGRSDGCGTAWHGRPRPSERENRSFSRGSPNTSPSYVSGQCFVVETLWLKSLVWFWRESEKETNHQGPLILRKSRRVSCSLAAVGEGGSRFARFQVCTERWQLLCASRDQTEQRIWVCLQYFALVLVHRIGPTIAATCVPITAAACGQPGWDAFRPPVDL